MLSAFNNLSMLQEDPDAVNRAFSKQATHFDEDDRENVILQDLRKQIYDHVDQFLKPASRILELNAGTGIDAVRFVRAGHSVHATDLSDGMIAELERKKKQPGMERLSIQQLSFGNIDRVQGKNYDLVFSNFGGLNCTRDLSTIGEKLRDVLKPGGLVTMVIMPVVSPWEVATILRGNRYAFRRWTRNGTLAHLEGERFPTWYHNVTSIKRFMPHFSLVRSEGIASLSPPPYKPQFPNRYPGTYKMLRRIDRALATSFPFNRWADHIIVTMQLNQAS
jgi:ubiquinone/menaquinone biosynthesis C-methylase UbiE